MIDKINYLTEQDINKTPIKNIKKIVNGDYMSYIIYLCYNDNIPEEERLFILNRLKEIKSIENKKFEIEIERMNKDKL
jgi:hypothetical protein